MNDSNKITHCPNCGNPTKENDIDVVGSYEYCPVCVKEAMVRCRHREDSGIEILSFNSEIELNKYLSLSHGNMGSPAPRRETYISPITGKVMR